MKKIARQYAKKFKEDALSYVLDHSDLNVNACIESFHAFNTVKSHSHCGYLSPKKYQTYSYIRLKESLLKTG